VLLYQNFYITVLILKKKKNSEHGFVMYGHKMVVGSHVKHGCKSGCRNIKYGGKSGCYN